MKLLKSVLFCLLLLAVGSIAYTGLTLASEQTKETSSSSLTSSEPEEICFYYTMLDFQDLTINNNPLTKEVMLEILNSKRDIFESVSEIQNVFRDEGSLKFGNSTTAGSLKLTLKEGYEINQVIITGRSYSRLTIDNNTWSCDKSAIIVNLNGSSPEAIVWPTNEVSTNLRPEQKTIKFTTNNRSNWFQILGSATTTTSKSYRFDIYKIEFWLGQL